MLIIVIIFFKFYITFFKHFNFRCVVILSWRDNQKQFYRVKPGILIVPVEHFFPKTYKIGQLPLKPLTYIYSEPSTAMPQVGVSRTAKEKPPFFGEVRTYNLPALSFSTTNTQSHLTRCSQIAYFTPLIH